IERWHMHRLTRDQNIEFIRVEHEFARAAIIDRLPEIKDVVRRTLVHIHHSRMVLAAIADQPVRTAREINRQRYATAGDVRHFRSDQRFRIMERGEFGLIELGPPLAEAYLRQARTRTHHNRKRAWADFQIKRTIITGRHLVEFLRAIGNDAREDIQTARRAFRSEEHTSELQSRENLVCRLLLDNKNLEKLPADQKA